MRNLLHLMALVTAVAVFAACNGGSADESAPTASTSQNGEGKNAAKNRSPLQDEEVQDDHTDHEHGEEEGDGAGRTNPWKGVDDAICVLSPGEGSSVRGVLRFRQTGKGVRITGEITGLTPDGTHAFHIHEFGDISGSDGMTTGGHFNPEGHEHGLPEEPAESRHAGDLGNLKADANGVAQVRIIMDKISIAGRTNPIVGRAIIIHAMPDDGGQPVGNAGARIGMGVIGIAKPADD